MNKVKMSAQPKYTLNADGRFIIENYNHAKPFSNFFPGIAGVWGVPMWVFYVNRGQCIASCGVESKDKAIMEFQPANKSYRLTSLQGFRTFIKAGLGTKTVYWEPFQNHLEGTAFKKQQTLSMSAHDLTLTEVNADLGLAVEVNYFTLPEEPYSALVRRVTVRNLKKKARDIELVDGLPVINPYGLRDWASKNMSRTIEAWITVENLENKAPYYHLKVEAADTSQVTHIKEGNFFFSVQTDGKKARLLNPVIEAAKVFGPANDFAAPVAFLEKTFKYPAKQQFSNRTPAALSHAQFTLAPLGQREIVSLFGYIQDIDRLNNIVTQVGKSPEFVQVAAARNQKIIEGIKDYAFTASASREFDLYAGHTFLDNILRGGLPVSLKTRQGDVAFNVYSRKHGDPERDYNYFTLSPTFYSQGNGNYRDVNQNRRNDVWFNADVGDSHVVSFLNLVQADGYNPLVVKGTTFHAQQPEKIDDLLKRCVQEDGRAALREFLHKSFAPGDLMRFIDTHGIALTVDVKTLLGETLELCARQEMADHGEGFWADHWTYNLDLIESYLGLYPENLRILFLEKKEFSFYHNNHYVLPRAQRYVVTGAGVRQYHAVAQDGAHDKTKGHVLRADNGHGDVYRTHLLAKMLCLVANKAATLDPSGIGVEMEADKPNWYDALNGLPGLLGSSSSETFEVKRVCRFLLKAVSDLSLNDNDNINLFEELAVFIERLRETLRDYPDALEYWFRSNDLKEGYRAGVRAGITGREKQLSVGVIKDFLNLVIAKTDRGLDAAATDIKGKLATYFYHEVTEHKQCVGDSKHVMPVKFKRHALPPFLEGYVHALRATDTDGARRLYKEARASGLFDEKLKMYRVNADISGEDEEIGRARVFPAGWLENASVWLHMEYKFILELLRRGLYEEFYDNFRPILVPFLNPERYGRSILENSSFIVSSAHEDKTLHGQGFVARLSGSTAEFMHMWLWMNVGKDPFTVGPRGELTFTLNPALPGWLFTKTASRIKYFDLQGQSREMKLPKNCYAFNLFGSTLVVYHNPRRHNTYGGDKPPIKEIHLLRQGEQKPVVISGGSIVGAYAQDIRDRKIGRVDVFFAL